MSHLASRRDRSATPPEQKHYDADWEVRNRGTGFYAFSTDEKDRAQQMEELSRVREETLNKRRSNKERLERREAKIKWRLEKIRELKNRKMAAQFMTDLESTIPTYKAEQADNTQQVDRTE
jgi:transposase-like protein